MIALASISGRPKQLLLAIAVLAILSLAGLCLPTSTAATSLASLTPDDLQCSSTGWTNWFASGRAIVVKPPSAASHDPSDLIATSHIEDYAQKYLSSLVGQVNHTHYLETQGLKLGSTDLRSYTHELLDTYTTYLSSRHSAHSHKAWLPSVKSRLSFRPSPTPLPAAPKQVMTTDKYVNHLPREFGRWHHIMPDWSMRIFDDAGLIEWVDENFGGTRGQRVWEALPRRVLQTDVFRYLAMLVEGGIYTDRSASTLITSTRRLGADGPQRQ